MAVRKRRNVAILLALLALAGGLLWFAGSRLSILNEQLLASQARIDQIQQRLTEYSQELDQAVDRAKAARLKADEATRTAQDATVARVEAEQQADAAKSALELAETDKQQAHAEAIAARNQTIEARKELQAIQTRREAELDRMKEALNRIAPTKRTPSGMVMTLTDSAFRFDFDKAALHPENRETLSRIAGVLLASEGYRLFVDGHTDDVGADDYNNALSERRADAVRNYLVGAGIPPDVITIQGFGKKQPLVNERTAEARAQNRRVEIGIVDTIIHYEAGIKN